MYLMNSCMKQLNRVITQERPCMDNNMHWLDPLLDKCDRRDFLYDVFKKGRFGYLQISIY